MNTKVIIVVVTLRLDYVFSLTIYFEEKREFLPKTNFQKY